MDRAYMKRVWGLTLITGCLAAIGIVDGCNTSGVGPPNHVNQPPNVWLAAAPPEGSVGTYTVKLYWGGWDPDGRVDHYEYLITDNVGTSTFDPNDLKSGTWYPVLGNDSSFTFSADVLQDTLTTSQVSIFQRSHTFFIRAVDDQGAKSPRPAYRSFTAQTLSPEVSITTPVKNQLNPADLPPIATYEWEAKDYVNDLNSSQDPDSVQWALVSTAPYGGSYDQTITYLRSAAGAKEFGPWHYYKAPGDSGKFWTTPPQEYGNYVFAMKAKDEAGAITPVLDEQSNVRRIRVSKRTVGPNFTMTNDYLGAIQTTSCSTPVSILDIPAGVPLVFTLSADASSYGGKVAGYRYGWDIADVNDPNQWEIDYTPFVTTKQNTPSRTFFFGTHVFSAEVIDNSGFCSRVQVKVNIIQFTLERNLLIVDDYDEKQFSGWDDPIGRGVQPTDAEHDAFWLDMVRNLSGFDPERDVITATFSTDVPLTKIAQYKSIVWSSYSDYGANSPSVYPALYKYIQYRSKTAVSGGGTKIAPNLLSLAMAAGSHVMITGRQPVQNVLIHPIPSNIRFPVLFLYDENGQNQTPPDPKNTIGDQTFGYKDLCVDALDLALLPTNKARNNQSYCNINRFRRYNGNSPRDDTMREGFPIDPDYTGWPTLHLRPEAAGPGKYYEPSEQGLAAEVYDPQYFSDYCPSDPPPRSCFQPIYGLECFDTAEPTYHQPIAFWTSVYKDRVAEVPGAIGARSIVFGFPPVFINPDEFRPAMEHVMFDEWQLPRVSTVRTASASALK